MNKYRLKREMAVSVLLGTLRGMSALVIAWFVNFAADMVITKKVDAWNGFALTVVVYYIGYLLFYRICRNYHLKTLRNIRIWLKERMTTGLIWEKEDLHATLTEGEVTSKFGYYVQMLEESWYQALILLISNAAVFLITFAAVTAFDLLTAAGIGVVLLCYLAASKKINQKLETLQEQEAEANRQEMQELHQMVKGYDTARDYGREQYFLKRYVGRAAAAAEASRRYSCFYAFLSILNESLEPLMGLAVIFGGGLLYAQSRAGVTVGGILAVTHLLTYLIGPVGSFGSGFAQIRAVRKMKNEVAEWEKAGLQGKPDWECGETGEEQPPVISLENVCFSYGDIQILDDVSVVFGAGKKYAIIGKSGEGKTTLLRLLIGQQNPQKGAIYRNGINYREIRRGDLLSGISYVGQEPVLFHKSIRENITAGLGERQDFESVASRSWLAEVAAGKTQGFDTVLETSGGDVSGGERQRIALARALYKDAPVLILDEFHSAMQEKMAGALEREILSMKDKTVIAVTHRLKPEEYQQYDGVYELRQGKLVCIKA